jgi:hypothetical protein
MRSSVGMLPARQVQGAAADPAAARIENANAGFDGRIGIGETGVARLWKCARSFTRGKTLQQTDQLGDLRGLAIMVSAMAISSGSPAATARSRARIAGTSPSNGQPNAVEIVICARIRRPGGFGDVSRLTPSSMLQP